MMAPTLLALASLALAAGEGPSFDCAKARSADEKLVCEEPALAALDRELASAYAGAAKAAADPDAAAGLRAAQRAWLAERATCTRWLGDARAVRNASVGCLETSYGWRRDELAKPRAAPELPEGIVERRILRRDPRMNEKVDVSYPALASGRPGAAAFDALFAKEARARVPTATRGDAALAVPDERPESTLEASFTVPLATARLVTVVTEGYEYGGGAHGMPSKASVTFDLERGRPLELDDLFAEGAKIADALLPVVMARLPRAPSGAWPDARKNARRVLGAAPAWTFLADRAVVTFPPYAVAPYGGGSPEVAFTWSELAPHLKPGAPLPPR